MTAPRINLVRNTQRIPLAEKGRNMSASEVAVHICGEKRSARWVIEHLGPRCGKKPGRDWLFYENEARLAWDDYLNGGRKSA